MWIRPACEIQNEISSISINLGTDHLLWITAVAPKFAVVNITNGGFYALTLYKAVYCYTKLYIFICAQTNIYESPYLFSSLSCSLKLCLEQWISMNLWLADCQFPCSHHILRSGDLCLWFEPMFFFFLLDLPAHFKLIAESDDLCG